MLIQILKISQSTSTDSLQYWFWVLLPDTVLLDHWFDFFEVANCSGSNRIKRDDTQDKGQHCRTIAALIQCRLGRNQSYTLEALSYPEISICVDPMVVRLNLNSSSLCLIMKTRLIRKLTNLSLITRIRKTLTNRADVIFAVLSEIEAIEWLLMYFKRFSFFFSMLSLLFYRC